MSTPGNAEDKRILPRQPAAHHALKTLLRGCNIYLVGMMGSGKSTIGPILAAHLGYRFVDIDATIEKVCGCSIADIFAAHGEEEFRRRESSVLESVASWHSLVVATGGGVVLKPQNWGIMRQGVVVWLRCPQPLLLRRLTQDGSTRPLLGEGDLGTRLSQLLAAREGLYLQADVEVPQQDGQSPQDIAVAIEAELEKRVQRKSSPTGSDGSC